jgi:hypothetical protein
MELQIRSADEPMTICMRSFSLPFPPSLVRLQSLNAPRKNVATSGKKTSVHRIRCHHTLPFQLHMGRFSLDGQLASMIDPSRGHTLLAQLTIAHESV